MNDLLDFNKLKQQLRDFATARDWNKFHTPKNLAMAIAGESGELTELFQWLTPEESTNIQYNPAQKQQISHEIADLILYLVRLADLLEININEAITNKFQLNEQKYPTELVKGSAKKYTEYNI